MTRIAVAWAECLIGVASRGRRGPAGEPPGCCRSLVDLAERSGAEIVLTTERPAGRLPGDRRGYASSVVPAPPLDVLGAESQGRSATSLPRPPRRVRGTRIRRRSRWSSRRSWSGRRPAFNAPTKPVGRCTRNPWRARTPRTGWRCAGRRALAAGRRVAAPSGSSRLRHPLARGDGRPRRRCRRRRRPGVELPDGRYEGREAVIDKDLARSCSPCRRRGWLILLTDVAGVMRGWGPGSEMIGASPWRRRSRAWRPVPGAGSMGPKVRACADFVRAGSLRRDRRARRRGRGGLGRAGTRSGPQAGLPREGARVGAASE